MAPESEQRPASFSNRKDTSGASLGVKVALAMSLVLAMLVIGLLGTTFLARTVNARNRTAVQRDHAMAQIERIYQALEHYASNNLGHYPETLAVLVLPDENGVSYLGGDTLPVDPWGNEYRYESRGADSSRPSVYCTGADGEPGGEGPDADLPLEREQPGEDH